jgi:hypothetical protein
MMAGKTPTEGGLPMQIHVLIDPVGDNHYRAYGGPPFPFSAEGETPYEAVKNLRQLIQERLKAGAHFIRIEIPATESHPAAEFAGIYKNDPLYEEWRQAVEEYRRQVDADPNAL